MGLVSILLHCNANMVLEIFKHDKIWGICISVPTPISGGLVPQPPPMIYAHLDEELIQRRRLRAPGMQQLSARGTNILLSLSC